MSRSPPSIPSESSAVVCATALSPDLEWARGTLRGFDSRRLHFSSRPPTRRSLGKWIGKLRALPHRFATEGTRAVALGSQPLRTPFASFSLAPVLVACAEHLRARLAQIRGLSLASTNAHRFPRVSARLWTDPLCAIYARLGKSERDLERDQDWSPPTTPRR
jgi:hypothetical protein